MANVKNNFVFVVPVYNASKTIHRLLHSICGQSYENWRIILIDDCSDRYEQIDTNRIIHKFQDLVAICDYNNRQKIDVTWNSDKRGKQWEVSNVLYGISKCRDDEIVCLASSDDWLTDLDALAIINDAYNEFGCEILWTAHRWNYTNRNISDYMPNNVDPYKWPWVSNHLKTFRRSLINGVPYENFTNMNGDLVKRAGDQAIYLPCLYRSNKRLFLPRVMYHYSIDEKNGEVYRTDDAIFQKSEADFIRSRGYVSSGTPWEAMIK